VFDRYPGAADYRWVQEEPANQGAWPFYGLHLGELFPDLPRLTRVSRRMMSAPSAGSSKVHEIEQRQIIEKAFS
jgi:2-oxoglutarate decarboxylase